MRFAKSAKWPPPGNNRSGTGFRVRREFSGGPVGRRSAIRKKDVEKKLNSGVTPLGVSPPLLRDSVLGFLIPSTPNIVGMSFWFCFSSKTFDIKKKNSTDLSKTTGVSEPKSFRVTPPRVWVKRKFFKKCDWKGPRLLARLTFQHISRHCEEGEKRGSKRKSKV